MRNRECALSSMKLEARQVAVLLHQDSKAPVGKLYLWQSGEADPMWFDEEFLDAIVEPLPDESCEWAKWKLGG